MNRYRIALVVAAAIAAAAVVFTVVRQAGPDLLPQGSAASSALLPEEARAPAPEFRGIDAWVNSPPLSMAGLRGHVVLVDFWTFSCVNCVRTFPHLHALDRRYHGDGLVIVGIHSPEFDFEKDQANVHAAVSRLGVTWPVAVDSEMTSWNAWSNSYWPAEYLVDKQGRVAYFHFGEGEYASTESAVAALLGLGAGPPAESSAPSSDLTPELYAGSLRGKLADGEAYGPLGQSVDYGDRPPPRDHDTIQVTGRWTDHGQFLEADGPAHVRLNFRATDVFVVAGSAAGPVTVSVTVDGAGVPAVMSGPALSGSGFTVARNDLFQLLAREQQGNHVIDLAVPEGFQLFTFTFG